MLKYNGPHVEENGDQLCVVALLIDNKLIFNY